MSSKLVPANPADVMVIRDITPNIATLSVPFARFGIFRVGGRATLVRLTSGTLAVFSPVALTADVKAKVAAMGGNVGYLVAPDIEHHIFLSEWSRAYPGAKLIGPAGLPQKRKQALLDQKSKAGSDNNKKNEGGDDERTRPADDETFAFVFSADHQDPGAISAEFAADFAAEYVGAHPNREIVLLYRPDRVLIEADLLFNMPATEQYSRPAAAVERKRHPWINRAWDALLTTEGPAKGHKRAQWYLFSNGTRDRAAFNASIRRIDAWDFDTIIPCHGDVIEGNAKEVFRKIFEWHLQG
ncbi:hypothetical protein SLS62_003418 [Diatrype stigma]|uniref:DUF4336 domain-containing protein n=1 Tax=Diatrype stigma TaxID=117547 RepID=A0AAN9V509_9PEZI